MPRPSRRRLSDTSRRRFVRDQVVKTIRAAVPKTVTQFLEDTGQLAPTKAGVTPERRDKRSPEWLPYYQPTSHYSDVECTCIWDAAQRRLTLDFPFAAVGKPKATGRGWRSGQRGDVERFKVFRTRVRTAIMLHGLERLEELKLRMPVHVRLVIREWTWIADPDNVEGGILDSMKPWPLPNDRWREIRSLRVERPSSELAGKGFAAIFEEVVGGD